MSDYFVVGTKRSGKTLYCIKVIRDCLLRGGRVATNVDLHVEHLGLPYAKVKSGFFDGKITRIPDFPTAKDLQDLGEGYSGARNDDSNGVIVLDECGGWLNSRDWNSPERKDLYHYLLHSGKLRWHVYYIVHSFDVIDKQIRESFGEFIIEVSSTDNRFPLFKGYFPRFHTAKQFIGQDMLSRKKKPLSVTRFRIRELYLAYDTEQKFISQNRTTYIVNPSTLNIPKPLSVVDKLRAGVFFKKENMGLLFLLLISLVLFSFLSYKLVYNVFFKRSASTTPTASVNTAVLSANAAALSTKHCTFFTSPLHPGQPYKRYSHSWFSELLRYEHVVLSDLIDSTSRPRFTLKILDAEGHLVDKSDDAELSIYGFQVFYYLSGIVFNDGVNWVFFPSVANKHGFFDGLLGH